MAFPPHFCVAFLWSHRSEYADQGSNTNSAMNLRCMEFLGRNAGWKHAVWCDSHDRGVKPSERKNEGGGSWNRDEQNQAGSGWNMGIFCWKKSQVSDLKSHFIQNNPTRKAPAQPALSCSFCGLKLRLVFFDSVGCCMSSMKIGFRFIWHETVSSKTQVAWKNLSSSMPQNCSEKKNRVK